MGREKGDGGQDLVKIKRRFEEGIPKGGGTNGNGKELHDLTTRKN